MPVARLEGLRELQRGLKRMAPELAKELRESLKALAEETAIDARGAAALHGTRQQQTAAYNIVGSGTYSGGAVVVTNKNDLPWALGAFWGSKRPQFPGLDWVGKNWDPGTKGQGPYFLNDALADDADEIVERLSELVEEMAIKLRAFPQPSFDLTSGGLTRR